MADDIIDQLATACTCGPLDADGVCLPCCARKEIERLRAELATFVSWGEWFTVEGLCNHNGDEPCTRTDHVKHPMFVRWEARRG